MIAQYGLTDSVRDQWSLASLRNRIADEVGRQIVLSCVSNMTAKYSSL